jgi:hypothetical protein
MVLPLPLSINQLQTILYHLQGDYPNLNKIGEITREGRWNHLVNGLLHRSQPRLLVLVEKVNQTLSHLEQKGVKIFDASIADPTYKKKAHSYRMERKIYLDVAEAIRQQLSALQEVCPELKKAYCELQRREVSLRYNLGEANGGLDALAEPNEELLADLKQRAIAWKIKQKLTINSGLNELDERQLKELAKYPEWLKIVRDDPSYFPIVLDWCLTTFNQPEIIIKYPEFIGRLNKALLKSNLGYVRNIVLTSPENEILAFTKVPTKVDRVAKRILTAAIYHGSFKKFEPEQQERINILKPNGSIHFKKGNYTLTVQEFLEELGQKNKRESKISLCADWGFINFDSVQGVWNASLQCFEMPDMTGENATDHVPPARIVAHEELVEQYGEQIKDRRFFFKIMASRKHLDLNALDCHAFWQFYIRMDDGNWKVINPGVFAYRFPQNALDALWMFGATLVRVLCLMDQNGSYTHRQRGGYADFSAEEKQTALLASIYRLISSNGVFQMLGHNCAFAVQTMTGQFINDLPNIFRMPVTEAKTGIGPFDRLLAWAHHQWEWVRWLVLSMVHTLFLSHRSLTVQEESGEVHYSTREYFRKYGHDIFNPSYFLYQIEQARKTGGEGVFAKGEIYWSHTDEKIFQARVQPLYRAK